MQTSYTKLEAANKILCAESPREMFKVVADYWLDFLSSDVPYPDIDPIQDCYEVLRQRAFEYVMNHRLAEIESHLGMGSADQ